MNKLLKRISILACLLVVLVLPYFVFAKSELVDNLVRTGNDSGYKSAGTTTISAIAGTIVSAVLGLLGVIFVVLIVYAGFTWMTAEGDEAKVEKAQKIIKNSIIGLVVTVSAFAIYNFVLMYFILKN